MPKTESDKIDLKLCVNCFNCKTKLKEVYCIKGAFKEKPANNKSIIHTPMDFECEFYED